MVRYGFLTILFLVVLRVGIGWHFFFEGFAKVRSEYAGEYPTKKKFSGEAYFVNATGPAGPFMREQLGLDGDPDLESLRPGDPVGDSVIPDPGRFDLTEDADFATLAAKLRRGDVGLDEDRVKAIQGELLSRMPERLNDMYDKYHAAFVEKFGLDGDQKSRSNDVLDTAKADLVVWLLFGTSDEGRARTGTPEKRTVRDRLAEYELKQEQLARFLSRGEPDFAGDDVGQGDYYKIKAEAKTLIDDLEKDLKTQTDKLKGKLAAVLWAGVPSPTPQLGNDASNWVEALTVASEPAERENVTASMCPESVAAAWDRHVAAVKAKYGEGTGLTLSRAQELLIDKQLENAKIEYARWLLDRDPATGTPTGDSGHRDQVKRFRDLAERLNQAKDDWLTDAKLTGLKRDLGKEIAGRSADLKKAVAGELTTSQTEANWPEEEDAGNERLQQIDWLTRWGLTVVGGLLIVGLFTRLACLAAAGFLVMTYLLYPAFPWLPTVGPSESQNYFFVNKNVIEMLALFALVTVPSGRWFGLDGLLTAVLFRRKKKTETAG